MHDFPPVVPDFQDTAAAAPPPPRRNAVAVRAAAPAPRAWLVGMYGAIKMVTRKVTQMGHVLPQRTPTGEVLSVASGDSDQFGSLNEVIANLAGAVAAYLVIAGLVLSTSWQLGVVVLVT